MSEQPWTCPTCGGQGTVQKPPWVAGDQHEWTANSTRLYTCPPCNGTGLVWAPTPPDLGDTP